MADEAENGGGHIVAIVSGGIESITDSLWTAVTQIPTPVRKAATSVFVRIITSLGEIPEGWLAGRIQDIRSNNAERKAASDARIKITVGTAESITKQIDVDPAFVDAAISKSYEKIVRERLNLNKIALIAAEDLVEKRDQSKNTSTEEAPETAPIPTDDWLNVFEDEAAKMSSEQMQTLFGKILAGEIRKPKTYSIKTLKVIAQLDNKAAELFVRLCSLSVSLKLSNNVLVDVRVISLNGSAGQNSLEKYGLSFNALNILFEYGLIISDYNANMDYRGAISIDNRVDYVIFRHSQNLGLGSIQPITSRPSLPLDGVVFTNAGRELFPIVDVLPMKEYEDDLVEYFHKKGLVFIPVAV
jgi:hypothetical protein